jgi:hypothetical protein
MTVCANEPEEMSEAKSMDFMKRLQLREFSQFFISRFPNRKRDLLRE